MGSSSSQRKVLVFFYGSYMNRKALAEATHEELARLYAHARDVLGGVYLPEAVLARSTDGSTMAALCYIAPHMDSRAPSPDYVDRIVAVAREFGFPEAYVARLESFREYRP